jgi:hypothetical protein
MTLAASRTPRLHIRALLDGCVHRRRASARDVTIALWKGLMLTIIADHHDNPLELTGRRDRFTAAEFAPTVAPDARSGSVRLVPQQRTLAVSSSAQDYQRVRVLGADGALLGTLACSPDGHVSWSPATRM